MFTYMISQNPEESEAILESLFKRLFRANQQVSLDKILPYEQCFQILEVIFQVEGALKFFLTNSILFMPQDIKNGYQIQHRTLFGSCLRLTTFPTETKDWEQYFKKSNYAQLRGAESQMKVVRERINIESVDKLHSLLFLICKNKNLQGNSYVTKWMEWVINLNKGKKKLYNQQEATSSNSFLLNFLKITLKFAKPFIENLDQMSSKLSKIDINKCYEDIGYFHEMENIAIFQEQQSKKMDIEKKDYNVFITQLVRINVGAINMCQSILKDYMNFHEQLNRAHEQGQDSPQFMELIGQRFAIDVFFKDSQMWKYVIQFFAFQSLLGLYLNDVRILQNGDFENINSTKEFCQQKLIIVEDFHKYLTFLRQAHPYFLEENMQYLQVIFNYLVILMGHSGWCQNPHARSELIIIFALLLPAREDKNQKDSFGHLFKQNIISDKYLMESMVNIFIDAEKTGTSSQFYDKFNLRFHFCNLFSYLLEMVTNRSHLDNLIKIAKTKKDLFLEFANLYLNDIIYLLDEALEKLQEIKKLESEDFSKLGQIQKMEKEKDLKKNKGIMKTLSMFLNVYYQNIALISQYAQDIFLAEEIRDKLVNNMNYTVFQLNSKEAYQKYKVNCMAEIKFDPKYIMKKIVELYLNFAKYDSFLESVLKDKRSFVPETFNRTADLLQNNNILQAHEANAFRDVLQKLANMSSSQFNIDEIPDEEIPEEFQDGMLYELMTDPVKLPQSGTVVDRLTIKKHLLSDKTDPFSKSPLTIDQLIEMPELKKQIEAFIAKKKNEKTQKSNK